MKRSDWNILSLVLGSCVLESCVLGSAVLVSCGAPGVPIPPALELAKPVTDLRAARKGDRVYLAWTVPTKNVDRQTVRHPGVTRICRSLNAHLAECESSVAEIPPAQFPPPASQSGTPVPKVQASYIDTLSEDLQKQNPTVTLTYALSVQNASGRSAGLSNQVNIPSAPTLPPPGDFGAQIRADGILLSWNCPSSISTAEIRTSDALTYNTRIYRRELGKNAASKITDAPLTDCLRTPSNGQASQDQGSRRREFLDQTFEWEKHYDYHATLVTIISEPGKPESEVEGDDTPVVSVFAHDIFPPAAPSGLQAVFSGVGQAPFVDLVWSPDVEADLGGYNVFRREEGGLPVKLNSTPVKTPAFRDSTVESGKQYFYSVSAVDERNNESAKSEEASEQVP